MALILGCFGKGFLFLMLIWDYDSVFGYFRGIIELFVLTSTVLALKGNQYHAKRPSVSGLFDA